MIAILKRVLFRRGFLLQGLCLLPGLVRALVDAVALLLTLPRLWGHILLPGARPYLLNLLLRPVLLAVVSPLLLQALGGHVGDEGSGDLLGVSFL